MKRLGAIVLPCLWVACAARGGGGPATYDAGPGSDLGGSDLGASEAGASDSGRTGRDAGPDAFMLRDGGPDRTCAVEACGNGLDDDCDGTVDEDCTCVPGETAPCFRGNPRGRSVGVCRDGTMTCEGFEFGRWGACMGDVLEAAETCDPNALDEDCDGAPNDGCECADGDPPVACGTDEGACAAGVQRCTGGMRTACEGATPPGVELCNGTDDDCDGMTDEGLSRACGSAVGTCRMGVQRCASGAWGTCEGERAATTEVCNALDDDCDGETDELVQRSCGRDVGRCLEGTQRCVGGAFGACEGEVTEIAEVCNGIDDDCDGTIDDGLVRPCGSTVGECRAGTETCSAGTWQACAGSVVPRTEVCDGVRDENCNGTVDEGCGCVTGTTRACGSTVGDCRAGSQVYDARGMWGACAGDVGPQPERCDGTRDENCSGVVDEGCACITGRTRACGSSVGACRAGTETCSAVGQWGACTGATGPTAELCNTVDDDCNGQVDEGNVCPRLPPVVMCPGMRTTTVGTGVSLMGSGNDPDGGSVTFAWSITARPAGSSAQPAPLAGATTSFTPDAQGDYAVRFCATDDESQVTCCSATVRATSTCTPPASPRATTCGTSWDRRPIVEFDPLPSGIVYELFLDGGATPYGTVTSVGQNYFRPATALGVGGPPPTGTRASLTVRACRTADRTCCTTSAPLSANLIEACSTPVAPTSANIVFSEYVTNGDGVPCSGPNCEAGEAIEITNLSNCPIALNGNHFGYCNDSCSTYRWMNFGAADIIPPRGVYVAIRNQSASMCSYPFFGADDPSLFGLKISQLQMEGTQLQNGWFVNSGGGSTTLRLATGAWSATSTILSGTTLERISPYLGTAGECSSIGFDAGNACGDVTAVATPTAVLTPNQLGRLWHPCDAVVSPVPASCR